MASPNHNSMNAHPDHELSREDVAARFELLQRRLERRAHIRRTAKKVAASAAGLAVLLVVAYGSVRATRVAEDPVSAQHSKAEGEKEREGTEASRAPHTAPEQREVRGSPRRAVEAPNDDEVMEGADFVPNEAGNRRMSLPDGSIVTMLDDETELDLLETTRAAVRVEVIAGRADFDVASGGDRELFLVKAGDVNIRVVGTQFTVERTPGGRVVVEVQEGIVSVETTDGRTRTLSANEKWEKVPKPPSVGNRSGRKSAEKLWHEALAHAQSGESLAAANSFTELYRGYPKHKRSAQAAFEAGQILMHRGTRDKEKAIAAFEQVRVLGGHNDEKVLRNLIKLYGDLGRSEQCAAKLERYVEKYPNLASAQMKEKCR